MKYLNIDPDPREQQIGNEPSLPKALREAVMRYRGWIILVTAIATVLATLYTLRMPKVYKAVTTLEYDPDPSNPLGSGVEGFSDVSRFLASREFFETQNLVMQSRAVSERVVEQLGLEANADFFDQADNPDWQPVPVSVAAGRLQSKISVDPIKETRLIRLAVRDHNPERAATLANAIVEAYTEKSLEDRLGATTAAADWLAQQVQSTGGDLVEAENALHDFKRQHNVLSLSLEDRQSLLAQEIREYNERLTDTRAHRIELEAHLARLKAVRADPEAVQEGESDSDSELQTLRSSIREKETQRASLSVRYGDAHPDIRGLDNEIASLRKSLAAEIGAMVKIAEGNLREAKAVETGLSKAQERSQQAGLELNRREIEYSRLSREQQTNSQLYQLLLQRTAEADLTRLLHTTHLRVVDRALVPGSPVSPVVVLNVAAGLVMGLFLGLALAWLLYWRDRSIRSVSDVEDLGVTVLGVLPGIAEGSELPPRAGAVFRGGKAGPVRSSHAGSIMRTRPMSAAAEACRTLRTNLTFMSVDTPIRTLVVTSASPKDGKTVIATNLAIAFAQGGQRVLLVDSDLRKPRVHEELNLENHRGLTSVLLGEQRVAEAVQPTDVDGLFVLTAGPIPPNPVELLSTSSFKRFLSEAASEYDKVIFDSPPVRAVTDAAVLAPQCEAAMLVARAGVSTRDELLSAVRRLRDVNANIVGAVLNDVTLDDRKGGAYGGYYHYAQSDRYGEQSNKKSDRHSQTAA
ncbi:MAG: polysaccharide biosynthesis tyrosine autokinase [Polyangiales bacterium]